MSTASNRGSACCVQCGQPIETWGCVQLCARCLCARLWNELEADDWVMVRRHQNGDLWVNSNLAGTRDSTNATALKLDVRKELEDRLGALV